MTSSMRNCVCVMSCFQSFSSPAHLAIGVFHCTPLLWNPTLCFVSGHCRGPTSYPRGSTSPPCSRSPLLDGSKSQHNWDISIIHGPRHCRPIFFAIFSVSSPTFLQQTLMNRDVLIFAGHPDFVQHSAGSEGDAQNLCLPSPYLVDHGATPRPLDTAIQDCPVYMTVDTHTLDFHGDSLRTVDVFMTSPASRCLTHTALDALNPFSSR